MTDARRTMMTTTSVARARAAFRERHIPENYSGPLHLATIVGISLLIALLCALMLENVTVLEWMTIPTTFFYANFCEYLGQEGPMHHKTRFLGKIYERHTIEHHSFFTDEATTYETTQDFKAILFSPVMLLFFHGCFALPVGAVLYFLVSANVCFLFVLTAILYFLNYELLHVAYHMDPHTWVGRLPFMDRLRQHHTHHHNKRLMTRYNFNITYPIFDYLFDTVYKHGD
jgi:hypothetical protein